MKTSARRRAAYRRLAKACAAAAIPVVVDALQGGLSWRPFVVALTTAVLLAAHKWLRWDRPPRARRRRARRSSTGTADTATDSPGQRPRAAHPP